MSSGDDDRGARFRTIRRTETSYRSTRIRKPSVSPASTRATTSASPSGAIAAAGRVQVTLGTTAEGGETLHRVPGEGSSRPGEPRGEPPRPPKTQKSR